MTRGNHPRHVLVALVLLAGGAGCEDNKDHRISGTVTFDGKPVPRGFITFEPDTAQGNSGPGGGAEIRDGKFTTAKGKGSVGGPYVVKIVGYDGVATSQGGEELLDGRVLFPPYATTADFPKENTTQDFTVPLKPPPGQEKRPPSRDGL